MSDYTPKDWRIESDFIVCPDGHPIATISGRPSSCSEETAANAALIARAPDLLAENERLRKAIKKVIGEYEKTEVGVTTQPYRILKQALEGEDG